jgi:hypothetical protein
MHGSPNNAARRDAGAGSKDNATNSAKPKDEAVVGADDYNARAIRHSIRVFLATASLMKLWTIVSRRLVGGEQEYVYSSFFTLAPSR